MIVNNPAPYSEAELIEAARAFALGFRFVPLWENCFPDFPRGDLPAIPAEWQDVSWHNDACPCFEAPNGLRVFTDYADGERREGGPDCPRFSVQIDDDNGAESLLDCDDWQAALDFVAAYVPPAKAEAPAPVIPQAGNLDALSQELSTYAEQNGLELMSADEMFLTAERRMHVAKLQMVWLSGFMKRWELEEARIAAERPAAWSDDFASQPDAVARLADAFRDVLKEWVGELGIRRIRRANVAFAGTDTCASHDECDANMAMDEAMKRTFGAGPLDGPQEHMTDAAMKLWADAWDKAKADYLTDAA